MTVDKYAHLRPPVDRSCHRSDRIPKLRLTQAEADARAAQHAGCHAYECPRCGWWHTGRRRRRTRRWHR